MYRTYTYHQRALFAPQPFPLTMHAPPLPSPETAQLTINKEKEGGDRVSVLATFHASRCHLNPSYLSTIVTTHFILTLPYHFSQTSCFLLLSFTYLCLSVCLSHHDAGTRVTNGTLGGGGGACGKHFDFSFCCYLLLQLSIPVLNILDAIIYQIFLGHLLQLEQMIIESVQYLCCM